jgi:hypothetical protein
VKTHRIHPVSSPASTTDDRKTDRTDADKIASTDKQTGSDIGFDIPSESRSAPPVHDNPATPIPGIDDVLDMSDDRSAVKQLHADDRQNNPSGHGIDMKKHGLSYMMQRHKRHAVRDPRQLAEDLGAFRPDGNDEGKSKPDLEPRQSKPAVRSSQSHISQEPSPEPVEDHEADIPAYDVDSDYDVTPTRSYPTDNGIGSNADLVDPDLNDDPLDSSKIPSDDAPIDWGVDDDDVDDSNQFVFDDPSSKDKTEPESDDDTESAEDAEPQDEDDGSEADEQQDESDSKPAGGWKQKLRRLADQAKAELHGEDVPDEDNADKSEDTEDEGEDTEDRSDGKDAPSDNDRKSSKNPDQHDHGGSGHHFNLLSPITGLFRAIFGLLHLTGRLARAVFSLGSLFIILWIVLGLVAAFTGNGTSYESNDEGTVTVSGKSFNGTTVSMTMKNDSDLIAHVSGTATVKAWAPDLNPISWVNPKIVASCTVDSVDINPGETRSVESKPCDGAGNGVWKRVAVKLIYE